MRGGGGGGGGRGDERRTWRRRQSTWIHAHRPQAQGGFLPGSKRLCTTPTSRRPVQPGGSAKHPDTCPKAKRLVLLYAHTHTSFTCMVHRSCNTGSPESLTRAQTVSSEVLEELGTCVSFTTPVFGWMLKNWLKYLIYM